MPRGANRSGSPVSFFFCEALLVVLFCSAPLTALAEKGWGKIYLEGMEYMDQRQWSMAVQAFDAAITENNKESDKERYYGMRYGPYYPYQQKGIALFQLGRYEDAIEAFKESVRQTATKTSQDYLARAKTELNSKIASIDQRPSNTAGPTTREKELEAKVAALQQQLSRAEDLKKQLGTAKLALKSRNDELNREKAERSKDQAALRQQLLGVKTELAQIQTSTSGDQAAREALEDELRKKIAQIEQQQDRLKKREVQINNEEKQIAQDRSDLEKRKQNLDQAVADARRSQKDNSALNNELGQIGVELKRIQQQAQTAKLESEKYKQESERYKSENNTLVAQLDKIKAELEKAKAREAQLAEKEAQRLALEMSHRESMLASLDRKRYALVIGNAGYQKSPLRNPKNDAHDIAGALKKLRFDVDLQVNADRRQMEEAIDRFGERLRKDKKAVGLFYYAGHGVQADGKNYLVPLKSNIKYEKDLRYKAVELNYLLDTVAEARNAMNVVILDACRDNPFEYSLASRGLPGGGKQKGLAQSNRNITGTLIAYATAPGNVSLDGSGENGIYTKHLLRWLNTPNITIEKIFKETATAVARETRNQQVPWINSSLLGDDFYLQVKQ
jgi:hypothetical protein